MDKGTNQVFQICRLRIHSAPHPRLSLVVPAQLFTQMGQLTRLLLMHISADSTFVHRLAQCPVARE